MGPMTTTPAAPASPLTVGFDLDLTLIDTRPGIKAAWEAFAAETGATIDADLVVTRLGPPLEHEMAYWFPEEHITEMTARYRALYPTYAIEPSHPMPGARDAIDAVREAGAARSSSPRRTARTPSCTSRTSASHRTRSPHGLWAEGKAEALRAHGAQVYVGDHVGDVRGAARVGALSVAVATGPCAPEELQEAGADVVLADLTDFRRWWEGYLA